MYTEDELLPLSGLQHLTFCERRFALIHIESAWEENRFTAEGRVLHDRAHSSAIESRPGLLIRRTLPLRSFRLGLSGQADIVEFEPAPNPQTGVRIEGRTGPWRPLPIEYKRRKDSHGSQAYRIQLCAQALCLEEMLQVPVPAGAVYDGTTRRRSPIAFTTELRAAVEQAAARMHELYRSRQTPPPRFGPVCAKCSLVEVCAPRAIANRPSVAQYIASAIAASRAEFEDKPR